MRRFSNPLGLVLAILSLLAAATPTHAGERPLKFDFAVEGTIDY